MVRTFRFLSIVCLLVLLVFLQRGFTPAVAQSGLESRLSRLEADNFQLRAEINQLESQISRLTGSTSQPTRVRPSSSATASSSSQTVPSALADDPTFKRLATLVIELRERIVALENRLKQLKIKN